MVGKSLGHYEILEPLGSGGMGDVYRAHDSSLNRDVAIKVLPEDLADDPDRLARLKREAHLLAALNHPNVATIHGFEESDGTRYLVMELVKGESLESRLAGGRLPVNEALEICRQIAEALETAHEEGIIHRDLKPSNVLITPDDRAKVLDFGLAKTVEPVASGVDSSDGVRSTLVGTQTGVILGTAPYMSPEQVRGKTLDKRTDIFAFGCVLYEALTGQRAFGRETMADTLAAVLELDPLWECLPASTPVGIQSLLRRCLRKDPKRRLHDIADARIEIEEAIREPHGAGTVARTAGPASTWRRTLPWAITALTATVAVVAVYSLVGRSADREVSRFHVAPPPGQRLLLSDDPGTAVSPDGSHIAYTTRRGLYLQAIDQPQARAVPGTEASHSPFFSPDGEWLGFFDDNDRTLKKVPLRGGPVQVISEAPGAHAGASWGTGETIVFSSIGSGLGLVSPSSDGAQSLTSADETVGERRHEYPEVLPNGRGVLFTIEGEGGRSIAVLDLESRHYETIVRAGTGPHYAATGHIVYGQDGALMAVSFDQDRLQVTGTSFRLREQVRTTSDGSLDLSFSSNGLLVFAPFVASTGSSRFVWVAPEGNESVVFEEQANLNEARLSPDGRHIALHGDDDVLWLYDVGREVLSVLASDRRSVTPTWSSDGRWVYYSSRSGADSDLFRSPTDLTSSPELVVARPRDQYVPSVSPDGSTLLYAEVDPATGSDIWSWRQGSGEDPVPIVRTPAAELWPQFSPDGEWFAYVADPTGVHEVYVRAFPGPGPQWQLSSGGGSSPRWSRDGRAVFYQEGARVMRVDIANGAGGGPGAPTLVFEDVSLALQDVAPDGRFLMLERTREPLGHLSVVLNWFEELKRQEAAGGL